MAGKKAVEEIVERALDKASVLVGVGQALDQGAWFNLKKSNPALAQAVAAAVGQGVTPEEISQYVVQYTGGKADIGSFVEQAARWVAAQGDT